MIMRDNTVFAELMLHERLLKAIDKLGFKRPTPVQAAALPEALAGHDLIVGAETGSGKTLAFVAPMLQHFLDISAPNTGTRGLILTPTRELAEQVCQAVKDIAAFTRINAMTVCGGTGFKEQAAEIRKNPEILVATPGRLAEHLERNTLDLDDLEFLVLDEADRMLDMGFRDEVMAIVQLCRPQRQSMVFSATLTHRGVREILPQVLNEPKELLLNTPQNAQASIRQQIILADDDKHKERLVEWLLAHETYDKAIIFTNTRDKAQWLAKSLQRQNRRSGVLHGEMTQDERKHVMELMRSGKINVLVATDVAARGLDIEGLDLVINFDMARKGDEHVHRVGRTGRQEREGLAICLIAHNEWNLMASIERYLRIEFERRTIKGVEGQYKGPKKVKASGKAAGSKKKKTDVKRAKSTAGKPKSKQRVRDRKDQGKRRSDSARPAPSLGDGSMPLMKKRSDR
ncbi:DEAD/DEAH box helicase [Marinobacterium sp. AK62]|uniref:DEAD/DEAH box helicase n=1 Tax=Marinobacterium alkalitolerans TaxID=1542925 RepID=A0ABS3Z843_9GAMM|nr:DEAD/DEAH box helicase [Marinobacterium alkalitolerans]MBP0047891.1 DEAD/DEAH box helicase [Marinobacterium alkalitolerans]